MRDWDRVLEPRPAPGAATGASRFGARSTAREVIGDYDLGGREAVVTGGTAGIGLETARALAAAGARVLIAGCDAAQGEAAAAALRRAPRGADVEFGPLDLASQASVRAFSERFLARRRALHFLINNAGIMAVPRRYTADGFESQFAVNHLGHFALTAGLLPALKAAGGARVVSVSSLGHCFSDVHFEDLHFDRRPYGKWLAYGQSKTANALFAVELTRRFARDGVTANAVMPGGVLTGLQSHLPRVERLRMGFCDAAGAASPGFKSAEEGAATSVWAAVAPELEGIGGRYLEDCAIAGPLPGASPERGFLRGYMPYALDPGRARRLWDASERLLEPIARKGRDRHFLRAG